MGLLNWIAKKLGYKVKITKIEKPVKESYVRPIPLHGRKLQTDVFGDPLINDFIDSFMLQHKLPMDGGDWINPKLNPDKMFWAIFETPDESIQENNPDDFYQFYFSKCRQCTYNDVKNGIRNITTVLYDADIYDGRDAFIGFAVWKPIK